MLKLFEVLSDIDMRRKQHDISRDFTHYLSANHPQTSNRDAITQLTQASISGGIWLNVLQQF
jgi:hypothetical protein